MASILTHRAYILIEFLILAVVLPTVIIVEKLAPYMFQFLWGTTAYCLLVFWTCYHQKGDAVWRWDEVTWKHLRPMLIRFAISSVFLLIFISIYDPARRFGLIGDRTDVWMMVMFFYPVLSALPQEFVFCTFFFVRYKNLFPKTSSMVAASTVVFAYAHVLFINPVAPLLSLIGGYFFASTYAQRRSLALVTIEHALYGNMLFTLGIGWYFWGGALR